MNKMFALFGAIVLAASSGTASAQDTTAPSQPAPPITMPAPVFEYVQQASSMEFDGTTMTLSGLAPSTVYFSDRPYRMVGHVDNDTFISLWSSADSTFSTDPPNAAVSVLGKINEPPAIIELTTAEIGDGGIQYGVKVLSGELPEQATDVALFVDHGGGFGGGGHGGGFGGGGHGGGFGGGHMGGGMPMGHPSGGYHPYGPNHPYHPYHPYGPNRPYHPYGPYHPVPGPYCYHSPQSPQCHGGYHPYGPYYPYRPYNPYYTGAALATGAAIGAAAATANQPQQVFIYPVPSGPLPSHCWLNSQHTRMICSVQLSNPPQ